MTRVIVRPAAPFVIALALIGCRERPALPPPSGQPIVLCAGDSITAASYPDHLQRLLDGAGLRLQVINAGVNGNTTGEYLSYLRGSRIIERYNPAWVLLQLGTNDIRIDGDATPIERFRENLGEILDLITRHRNPDGSSPRVILATIPPVPVEVPGHFDTASRSRVESEINPAILTIARQRGLSLADNHALFAARPVLLPEIHPSEEGYRALAETWYAALAPHLAATQLHPAGKP